MFDIQSYASFLIAILVFQLVPGPGTVAILNATARNGMRAGFGAVLGTLLGDFIYMTAAVLGLAAAMRAHPLLFEALQWFGAGYLCWLGIQLLRTRVADGAGAPKPVRAPRTYFRQACLVSLTNPKVMLFFVAFFPLFLRPDASGGTLAAMMLHVTALSFLYQAGLVLLGNAVALRLRAFPCARRLATRLAGIALVGFGLRLAASNR
jgi:threonine/homoserine/homoserine lactone efflux protein